MEGDEQPGEIFQAVGIPPDIGYALLSEAGERGRTITHTFLNLIRVRKSVSAGFTDTLRRRCWVALADRYAIADRQHQPEPTSNRRCAVNCEFRRFCNDLL